MFYEYDTTVNVLAFTDKEVAADWRNGMLRATANVIINLGDAEGATPGSWGKFNGFKSGSLGEHFHNSRRVRPRVYEGGHGDCAIVSVTNIYEQGNTVEDYNTFGSSSHPEITFTADVTCEHGHSGKMSYSSSLGYVIGTIAQATN